LSPGSPYFGEPRIAGSALGKNESSAVPELDKKCCLLVGYQLCDNATMVP
jgi:hypothetical protein